MLYEDPTSLSLFRWVTQTYLSDTTAFSPSFIQQQVLNMVFLLKKRQFQTRVFAFLEEIYSSQLCSLFDQGIFRVDDEDYLLESEEQVVSVGLKVQKASRHLWANEYLLLLEKSL